MELKAQRKVEMKLNEVLYSLSKRGLNFALYQFPQQGRSHLIIDIQQQEKEKGFVFAPFDHSKDQYFIGADEHIEFLGETLPISDVTLGMVLNHVPVEKDKTWKAFDMVTKTDYEQKVQEAVDTIKGGDLEKVVLSRSIERDAYCNAYEAWSLLKKKYRNAFVYYVHIHGEGEWVGATPECLLKKDGEQYETVSLAGSKSKDDFSEWGEKEKHEQQVVTDYISEVLSGLGVDDAKLNGPDTYSAGPVVHLRTGINFTFKGEEKELIKALHPTPAVCGLPKDKALEYITENEGYDRSFYAGYLGPIGIDNTSHYYVNLRCMKVGYDQVRLYAGGGITKDSIPSSEWEETDLKASTLLSVIDL